MMRSDGKITFRLGDTSGIYYLIDRAGGVKSCETLRRRYPEEASGDIRYICGVHRGSRVSGTGIRFQLTVRKRRKNEKRV
jgi:hypothetical protein